MNTTLVMPSGSGSEMTMLNNNIVTLLSRISDELMEINITLENISEILGEKNED